MNAIHFDSVGGASGDMILGTLIALGADINAVTEQIRHVVHDEFSISVVPVSSHGICGVQAKVECHAALSHDHDHGHTHHHRTWADIRMMINNSALPQPVKDEVCAVFEQIAQAEGRIHGKPPETVHFHEVGALDSIVDIVGCCCAKVLLDVHSVTVGPLPLGCGVIECRHGTYPCPAPATQELLNGMAVVRTEEPYELVTPTGAALLKVWSQSSIPSKTSSIIGKSVYSFGARTLNQRPNVLRAALVSEEAGNQIKHDECVVLQANLDDTNPELIGALFPLLIERGALDVFTIPVQMKKQRPGVLLCVICGHHSAAEMEGLIFKETTTFGIRRYTVERALLPRNIEVVSTPYGDIRVKCGIWQGNTITRSPEMDDCIRAATINNVSVRTVYEAAMSMVCNIPTA